MTTKAKTVDWGGLTVIANALYLGATKPQSAGTLFSTGGTVTATSTVTAGGPAGSSGAGVAAILKLNTADVDIVAADQLGRIEFAAPLEASGTDAIVVSASIWAEAMATFSASVNETDLVVALGNSEVAAEKYRITRTGGTRGGAPVSTGNVAAYAVLAKNSGLLHSVPDQSQTHTITLPAAAAGLAYDFMYGGAATDASSHIFVPTAGFFIGNVTFHDSQADATTAVYSDGDSNDVFTLVTPASYTLTFVSDGTNWYVNGHVQSATVCTMAD